VTIRQRALSAAVGWPFFSAPRVSLSRSRSTPPAARVYGQLSGAVRAPGRTPRRRHADIQIAATAASNGLPLYTTNPDDFAGLDEWVAVIPVQRPTKN